MKDTADYWSKLFSGRPTRRRALAGAAGMGLSGAALALIGCGGSGSKGKAGSSELYTPVDTRSHATKGGVLPRVGSPRGFDILKSAAENANASPSYSRLVKYETFKYPAKAAPTVIADAATSWETSPDGQTVTFKLRPNFKFDPRPPTNGKVLTSKDVKFSWDLYESKSVGRSNLANSVNPDAPVVATSAPDSSTVSFKLAFPYSPILPLLAFNRFLYILPSEADGGYNLAGDMRGTGAWRLKEFHSDSRYSFEKNPDWYDADKIYLDGLEYFIVGEYAAQLTQFRAGSLASMAVSQEDVLLTKRERPRLLMAPTEEFDRTPFWLRFGYLPDSPFRDERVRKAVSMTIDRQLYVDTFGDVERFKAAGLEVSTAWHSCFGAGDPSWLDPRDQKLFGENARWFKFDPAESKKLMTAAGYTTTLESKFTLSGLPGEGSLSKPAEVLAGMFNQQGIFNFKMNYVDLNAVFRPQYHYNYDHHEGIAVGGGGADYPDPDGNLQANFKSGLDKTGHLAADGKPDPYLDDLIAKQRSEPDWNKRQAMLQEYQRTFASKMYFLHQPGDALGFELAQPWFGNWRVYRGQSDAGGGSEMQEGGIYYWIDNSKKA